ncbi:hypothetical protein N7463_000229 [Penicillium fimorum]|uniref:Uncharacterized protein n=1 Tax=Penicillium fimorum TaxID=1882269 RepID=A0A9X0CAR0_9EURO|nr:hypothetical protein N7463_000229 [Penicillium fimorum]
MPLPETLFGGYSIGTSLTTAGEVQRLLDQLKGSYIHHIDTAASWRNTTPGRSETLLGEARAPSQGFKTNTRISPITGSSSTLREPEPSS